MFDNNNKKRVFITGFGIISAIGCGEDEVFNALLRKQSVIGKVSFLETELKNYPVAEIKQSNDDLARRAALPDNKIYSRSFLLGIIAVQQAMKMAGIQTTEGILSATSVGGVDVKERFYKKIIYNNAYPQLKHEAFPWLEIAHCAEHIAKYFNIRTNVTTISSACASSANSIMVGSRLVRNGVVNSILVGGMDALSLFSLNGFNSLEILSPTGCRPFDKHHNGITIGEGAAYLVLEAEQAAKGKKIYGEIVGYANRNEAFHQTSPSPDGAGIAMTMQDALSVAAIPPRDIDYINAHGTGTVVNDLAEGKAIGMVFGNNIPPVSSTKGFTGHTLAAAGAIEAVLSLLCLKHQTFLPNLGWEEKIEELPFIPHNEMNKANINYVLSNSLGFGGANSTLIIKKV